MEIDIDNIVDGSLKLQEDMHKTVEMIVKQAKEKGKFKEGSYQDATNIYLLMKLSELEQRICLIENALNINKPN